MRKLIWATLFLAVIGFASAAVLVTLNIPGTVVIVNPSLQATPSSLDWGSLTVNSTQGASATRPLSILNNGGVPLTLAYRCVCPAGFSLVLTGPSLGPLAPGAAWSGSAVLTVAAGTIAGTYSPSLVVTGS